MTEIPLQAPPYEIVKQGLDAIKRYFKESEKGSRLVKVVLVGDGEAGKTILRHGLAGRRNPRQTDRTAHIDIQKSASTMILMSTCTIVMASKNISQLSYLTCRAWHCTWWFWRQKCVTDKYAHAVEDKLHRFLVVLQKRVPGAVILPIVTKVNTVEDPKRRCDWLKSQISIWLEETQEAVCSKRPGWGTDCRHPPVSLASVANANDMRNASIGDRRQFIPIRIQVPATALAVADAEDVETVRGSVKNVRGRIIALTEHNPSLLCGFGQQIRSTYMAVLELFGAIAEYGDNGSELQALCDGTARALGEIETSTLSKDGSYRPKDELENLRNMYNKKRNVNVEANVFDDATRLWEAQGLVILDSGLIILQPEFKTNIVKPHVDHRYNDENECKLIKAGAREFINDSSLYDLDSYQQLIDALNRFRDSGEIETSRKSLFHTIVNAFRPRTEPKIKSVDESLLLSFFFGATLVWTRATMVKLYICSKLADSR